MPVRDNLGARMKSFYEEISKTYLMRRTPVAIRLDGRSFHTFTKGFEKPFDDILRKAMEETMLYLCKNVQGCVLGYHQSDEITLILTDYEELNTDAWFGYNVQKLCSIAASMATFIFNRVFEKKANAFFEKHENDDFITRGYADTLCIAAYEGATFDARCFNIPKEEVANLLYWRQLDAMRNSVQMVGQYYFSHKELHKKNQEAIKTMLKDFKNVDWERDYATCYKRGTCCIRDAERKWFVDTEIPIFKDEDRDYIEKLI